MRRRNAYISEALGEEEPPIQDFGSDGVNYYPHFETDKVFPTYHALSKWAKDIAINLNFEIVHSYNTNGWLYLRCNRGSRFKEKQKNVGVKERPNTSTQFCGCKFLIKGRKLGEEGWVVVFGRDDYGKHNHELSVYKEGHRQMSGLSEGAKNLVRDMTTASVKPSRILAAVNTQFPDDHATRRHIYNYRDRLRSMESDGRDVVSHFLHLAIEANYTHWSLADPDTNVLTHTFMAHPTSLQLLRTYPWVIGIDSTYKTNRYNIPFLEIIGVTPCNQNFLIGYAFMKDESAFSYSWVLDKLKLLIGNDVSPTAIVTDREMGLMQPIIDLFPNTAHLLCTWHINKDVELNATKLLGGKDQGERFRSGRWSKVLHATTEEDYNRALTNLKDGYIAYPKLIKYFEDIWLNPHKQKFVHCWTNLVLHFGNVTTCRVESAHSMLKGWLDSSTGSLDSVWHKMNKAIEDQVIQIKFKLERSRRSHGRKYSCIPLAHLNGRTSHYCLKLLCNKITRMRELSDQVNNRCGCAYKTTHQIPCACDIRRALDSGTHFYLDHVHPFWRTLVIGDDGGPVQEVSHFQSLVSEVIRSDPAVMRSASRLLDAHLHDDQMGYEEPVRNKKPRGRPRRNTRRDPSAWEYLSRGRGRGSRMDNSSGSNQMNISDFPFPNGLPNFIKPYVDGWNNVLGDGNCGFRCVADFFLGGEDMWEQARRTIAYEVGAHRSKYEIVYHEGIDHGIKRILWDGGRAAPTNYMEMPQDLYPIANFFCCAVMVFGLGPSGNVYPCMTVLPWRAPSTITQPRRDIAIAHIGLHYVRLDMSLDCPVPPIVTSWFDIREQSVVGWEHFYESKRALWDRLAPINS